MYSGALISSVSNTRRDWNLISFNVNSLNTLLTSKYTIPISDEMWENRHFIQQTRSCKHCHTKKYKTITDEEGNSSKEYYEDRTEVPIKEIQIIDVKGGLMFQGILTEMISTIDVRKLSNGIYFIKAGSTTTKFIKQ